MMTFARCVISDLSVKVLEYPEITIPEQELKSITIYAAYVFNKTLQPHTRS